MLNSLKWLLIGVLFVLFLGIIEVGVFYMKQEPISVTEKPESIMEEPKEEISEEPTSPEQKEVPAAISAFVKANKIGVVEILLPYDFEEDGRQEFLIGERLPGSAGALHWYVLFIKNQTIQKVEPPYGYKETEKGRFRGHNSVTITKEGLITENAPLYLPEDPNCCPSGGEALFFFQFENDNLKLLKSEFQEPKT